MSKHLSGVMVAVFAAAMLFTAPASADHRPGNVVVMGGTVSQTGRNVARAGLMYKARKLYVDELNTRGGLLGHKVELKIYDDKSDKRTAIDLYEKLITEDRVDLVLGPMGSSLTDPVANVMERYKRPFIAHATKPAIYQRGRKYIFSIPNVSARDRAKGVLHVVNKIGVERIAIISRARAASLPMLKGAQELAKKLGLSIVLSERFPKKQTDFTDLLQRIKASGAEAIVSISDLRATVAQLRQLRELNIDVKMFGASSAARLPKFVEELGITAEYVVGYSAWEPKPAIGYPGIAEFIENYDKRYGVKPTHHSNSGYTAMQIFVAAIKEAKSFDPEKVRDALASISVYSVRGLYKANEQGLSPIDGLAIQIQNGKRVIVLPNRFAEAKVLPMPQWEDRAKK